MLNQKCDPFLLKTMRRKVRRLLDIHVEVTDLEKDMKTLLDAGGYTIQTASGCGMVLASTIIGEIGDINRFTSPGALSKYAGCSPRKVEWQESPSCEITKWEQKAQLRFSSHGTLTNITHG